MARHIQKLIMVILTLMLPACLGIFGDESKEQLRRNLEGQILVWHTWEGEEYEILKKLLDGFTELYPGVTIAEETCPLANIEEVFSYEVEAGLGPDILIAPANLAEPLASRELIRDISDQNIDLDVYLAAAIDMLRNEDRIYGLPLSLNTFALYYNKTLLEQPQAADSPGDAMAKLI